MVLTGAPGVAPAAEKEEQKKMALVGTTGSYCEFAGLGADPEPLQATQAL
jgi:hypothetical protein